jgi:hypothetical protein
MTDQQILDAIRASNLTAEQLQLVLSYAAKLVQREVTRAKIAGARAAQSTATQQAEQAIQTLEAEFAAIDAELAAAAA